MASNTVYSGVKSSGELGQAIEKLMAEGLGKEARVNLGPAGSAVAQAASSLSGGESSKVSGGSSMEGSKKIVELRFPGGKLHGNEADADAFLRILEQSGMSA